MCRWKECLKISEGGSWILKGLKVRGFEKQEMLSAKGRAGKTAVRKLLSRPLRTSKIHLHVLWGRWDENP